MIFYKKETEKIELVARPMVSQVTADLSAEKTEVLTQVIKELAPVLDAETVVEVSNVVEETSEGEVKPEDVKHLAEMVEKLSDEVSLVRPSTRLGFSQFSRQNCLTRIFFTYRKIFSN